MYSFFLYQVNICLWQSKGFNLAIMSFFLNLAFKIIFNSKLGCFNLHTLPFVLASHGGDASFAFFTRNMTSCEAFEICTLMLKCKHQSSSDLPTIAPSILNHHTPVKFVSFHHFCRSHPPRTDLVKSLVPAFRLPFSSSPPFLPYSCHTCLLDLLADCRSRQLGLA